MVCPYVRNTAMRPSNNNNKWSKKFDKRPHRGRGLTVESYPPGGASVPCHVGTLAPPGEYN